MKKGKILLIFGFLFFVAPNIVFADTSRVTCSDLRNKYNEYNGVIDEYNSLNCDQADPMDSLTYETCVNLVYRKNSVLEELYTYNSSASSCDVDGLDDILDQNSTHCTSDLSSSLKEFASKVMTLFYMIAPFLLIIFGSIDFFKIVVNGDPKSIQKNRTNFIKRIVAFVLLYFTPYITKQILSLSAYNLTGDRFVCVVESSNVTGDEEERVLYSGIYGVDNSLSVNSSEILSAADSISKKWAAEKFLYFTDVTGSPLVYSNIKQAIDSPYKTTCCATLAGAVLYKSGLFTETQINNVSYNGAYNIAELLDNNGWMIIESYDLLQPGDFVFMLSSGNAPIQLRNGKTYNQGHVQIYAGNGRWYNAGSTNSIQGAQPSIQSDGYARGKFSFALRSPSSVRNSRVVKPSSSRESQSSQEQNTSGKNSSSNNTNTSTNNNSKKTNEKSTNTNTNNSNTNTNTNASSKGTNTKSTNTKKTK